MKILSKHTFFSILKVGFVTTLIASFLLIGVDLFKNLDTYMSYSFGFKQVAYLSFLYFPEAFLLGLGPSYLFAVTYYFSSLQANNELITLYNAGCSYKKIIVPCLILSVLISVLYFLFNEQIAIKASNKKQTMFEELTLSNYGKMDNNSIFFNDYENNFIIFADQYVDSIQALYSITYLELNDDLSVKQRIDSYKAVWDEEIKNWHFYQNFILSQNKQMNSFYKEYKDEINDLPIQIEPEYFQSSNISINNQSLEKYYEYVCRIKQINSEKYASVATEFYSRVLNCLTPLVLMIISCFSNIRFKKNVLFFSILVSLCFGVVYYVIRLLTIMLAGQGVIKPALGTLIPFICVIVISIFFGFFRKD